MKSSRAVYEGLRQLVDQGVAAGALLYGVTGSGKTQIYLHLIDHVLSKDKTALVLVQR